MGARETTSKKDQKFFNQTRAENRASVDQELQQHLTEKNWPIQKKIALACRKLASDGHAETLAGQVTVKSNENQFWTNPIAGGFHNIRTSTVIKIDDNLEVVEGGGIPNPGIRFHLWIYQARTDINAIIHTHPPYASALSMIGKKLVVAHMDAAMFYDDCAYLSHWPGVPIANEEGQIISEALGNKRSILLANHGLLTVGPNIEEATYLAIRLERAARLQLLAESAGEIQSISNDHALDAHDFLLQSSVVFGTFNAWCEEILHQDPNVSD